MKIVSVLQETLHCKAVVGSFTVQLEVDLKDGHPQEVVLSSRRVPGCGGESAMLLDTHSKATLVEVVLECERIAAMFSEVAEELRKRGLSSWPLQVGAGVKA